MGNKEYQGVDPQWKIKMTSESTLYEKLERPEGSLSIGNINEPLTC